jgi:hypothetical protein
MQPVKSRQDNASGHAPQVTCIHLTQGSSDDSVWVLEEGVGGTFLTIGSDPECEWQIRAAGMPPHALSVLLVGGLVYVRSGPQRGVRLDGHLLSEDWKQVESDARIDVGLAQLEIKLGKGKLLPSLRDVRAAAQVEARGSGRAQDREARARQPQQRAEVGSHAAAVRASPRDLERSGMRRTPALEPHHARRDPGRHEHQHRQQLRLDSRIRPRERSGRGFRYLLGMIVLGTAYALWVAWLDNVPWLDNLAWLHNLPWLDNLAWLDNIPWLDNVR